MSPEDEDLAMSASLSILHEKVQAAIAKYQLVVEAMSCDPELADTAAFCEHYGFKPGETCNTIITVGKGTPPKLACCVILASCKLDVNKVVCKLLNLKKCSFAGADLTLESTGMEIGGVTAVGIENMPFFVDQAVMTNEKVVLGGGNRSSKLLLNPSELKKLPDLLVVDGLGIER